MSLFNIAYDIAVIGIVKTTPILADNADINCSATFSLFIILIKFESVVDMNNNIKVNKLPIYAKIKVLDVVPIISFPTFIPSLNNSFHVISGVFIFISSNAETIDILTCIHIPIVEIIIPENKISLKL